jgi:hypothetical protein
MDVAEGIECARRGRSELLRNRDIAAYARYPVTVIGESVHGGRLCCILHIGHHHVHAAVEERAREGEPDAAGRAGDKRGLAAEIAHCIPPRT